MHPEFCSTGGDITFCNGPTRLFGPDRMRADRVEVLFRASKADQKRVGATITRSRVGSSNTEQWGGNLGAVEILLNLFDSHSDLGERWLRMQADYEGRWQVISRSKVTRALRVLVGSLRNDPQQFSSTQQESEEPRTCAVRGNGNTDPARRTLEISSVYGLCQSRGGRRGVRVQDAHSERQAGRLLN